VSADNGYILRKDADGKFVVQMYFASADEYPPIDSPRAYRFDTLEEAVVAVEAWETDQPTEYGLRTAIRKEEDVDTGTRSGDRCVHCSAS
jgi:hypothetical protein